MCGIGVAARAKAIRSLPVILAALAVLPAGISPPARADWQPVATGIDYQSFILPDPNNLFVVRMDRDNTACTLDSCIGLGKLISGRETVSSMAAKHEGAIGYWGQTWGQRYDVVAAINGDFFDLSSGVPTGGQMVAGWYAKRFPDFTGGSGFAWQLDRDAFIGECVRHIASKQKVAYPATGQDQNIDAINTTRGANQLVLYTQQYNLTTNTDATGSEVVVEMARPTLILPSPNYARGTVLEIRPSAGSTVIEFDQVVLSAHGTAATKLLNNVSIGSEIRISQEITHYLHDCSTSYGWDWTKTYAAVGGSFHFLKDGVLQYSSDPGATARHPRTAIAFNADYLFFVVVDGRSDVSVGMNMTELGTFCLNYLAATDGINQDGGGSSTLWVDGTVVNDPSDGTERTVANGMLMVVVEPKEQSTRFTGGQAVHMLHNATMRVGPGLNYAGFSAGTAGAWGTVLNHAVGGVLATGQYWWKCQFGGVSGWVPANSLSAGDYCGDFDADGDVEIDDLADFDFCLMGPTVQFSLGHFCLAGDADGDRDVDVNDFGVFQQSFTTP